MNIYIYGNSGFKKEIHSTLDHANIKFKLDDSSIIKDVMSLDELKNTIIENPNDIYLIDDEKIIKKNSKIKFLNPKDGIEESFLLDNGIADLSVESFAEIPKYILQKHEDLSNENRNFVNKLTRNFEKEGIEHKIVVSLLNTNRTILLASNSFLEAIKVLDLIFAIDTNEEF